MQPVMSFVKLTASVVDHILQNPTGTLCVSFTDNRGKEYVNHLFDCRDFVYKFLQDLYELHSPTEKQVGGSNEHDGKGFNRFDASFLMDVAKSSRSFYNLTDRQSVAVARRLQKYKKQIVQELEKTQNKSAQVAYNKSRPVQTSMFAKGYER